MRRRVVREIGTAFGVVVILALVVFFNSQLRRGTLKDQMEKVRQNAEEKQAVAGVELLNWDVLRKTTGSRKSGPKFSDKLLEFKDQRTSLIGFMVPLYEFRQMKEFMVLPVPIECYFCQAPPMRDVMLVQMAADKTADLINEPVLINGQLTLNEGPGTKFFYVMKDVELGPAEKGQKFTRKTVRPEAISHASQQQGAEAGNVEELLPPQAPPTAPATTEPPAAPSQ